MTDIDGKPMVSVVDMIHIHGDYKNIESAAETWRNTVKGTVQAFLVSLLLWRSNRFSHQAQKMLTLPFPVP